MDIEEIRDYVLMKNEVEEGFPFGESTLVFKVAGKMFLLLALDEQPLRFNVKCDPEKAEELREQYASVLPGYHMNKKHWNTIVLDGSLPRKLLKEMIDDSYDLVKPKTKAKK
ncbi:MAG: MmcQ-like protein [Pseudopedobacter saltans]|uniref:MmcQ-like protein n=1 Tax=Pseudopedobacter saltans TaxID=151895 RepID=A0A2W5HEA5_9SPHI|nr:MAG: MmcQ-like protein [Pseudopedobacter saltans]